MTFQSIEAILFLACSEQQLIISCLQNRYKERSMIESVLLALPFWHSCVTNIRFYFTTSNWHLIARINTTYLRLIYFEWLTRHCLKLAGDKSLSPVVQVAYCWDVFWIQIFFTWSPSQTSWVLLLDPEVVERCRHFHPKQLFYGGL